jgi:hypothetical protein
MKKILAVLLFLIFSSILLLTSVQTGMVTVENIKKNSTAESARSSRAFIIGSVNITSGNFTVLDRNYETP